MTYGLDVEQFRFLIVRPALTSISLWSQSAENLVLGTALQESHLMYLKQLPNGPALGPFQMEPETHADIWGNYLAYRNDLKVSVSRLAGFFSAERPDPGAMVSHLQYAAAMCRVRYARVSAPLPDANDAPALAAYYKAFYNTYQGKATVEQALPHFFRAVQLEQAA